MQVKELKKRQHYCYDPFQHHEKKQYKTLRVVTSRQVAKNLRLEKNYAMLAERGSLAYLPK